MDHDGPEEDVPEPGRQHVEAVGRARRNQARNPDWVTPERAARDKLSRQWTTVEIFFTLFGLMFFGFGACNSYAYHVGTPTTATNIQCVHHSRDTSCTGTWSIDGQTHTGNVAGNVHEGSSLDVRVHDGIAYAGTGVTQLSLLGAAFFIAGSVILGVKWARRRASRRTHSTAP